MFNLLNLWVKIAIIFDTTIFANIIIYFFNRKTARPGRTRLTSLVATTTTRLLRTIAVATDRATSDAGNSVSLYICLVTGHGESLNEGFPIFLYFSTMSLQDSYDCIMKKTNIYFENVVLDKELTENGIDLNELMALAKVLLTFNDNQGNGYRKAIPVMQYLHNEGVIYYDYDLATFYLEGKVIAEDGPLAIELLKGIASSPINDALSMRKLGDC